MRPRSGGSRRGSSMAVALALLVAIERAVDLPEVEEPAALTRLRAQMLRGIQLVAGPDRVRDLLIMEFLFN